MIPTNDQGVIDEGMLLQASSKEKKPTIPYSLNDKSTELLDNTKNDEESDQHQFQENVIQQQWWRKALLYVVWALKFLAFGQFQTKFYRNKRSTYSSLLGGVLSLILNIFLFIMIVVLFISLFNQTDQTMTQTRTVLKNWKHKDIKFKGLIDLGFEIPLYDFIGKEIQSIDDFNASGLQAVAQGSNAPGLMIQDDVKSLIPEINLRLPYNYQLDGDFVQFEGFYQKNGTSYNANGTVRQKNLTTDLYVNVDYTCFSNSLCKIISCRRLLNYSQVYFRMENGGMYRNALRNQLISLDIDKEHQFLNFVSSSGGFSYTISEKSVSVQINAMTVNFLDDTLYQYDETINNFDNGQQWNESKSLLKNGYAFNQQDFEPYLFYLRFHRSINLQNIQFWQYFFDSKSVYKTSRQIKTNGGFVTISLLHVINDTRIWPSFFYTSSSDIIKEQILIGSLDYVEKPDFPSSKLKIDDKAVTVVTYKSKTVASVLSEIGGLLVLIRILTFLLRSFNEWRFNEKIKKETNEEFREIFTYSNFKKSMVENKEIKAENQDMREQVGQLMQRLEDLERLTGQLQAKMKTD